MAPKKALPPVLVLPVLIFATSLLFQFMITDYLLTLTNTRYHNELRHLQTQITQDLAAQLARAQASNDDLAALAALRSARANHPQIVDAMIFDNTGKISLHTDSGWMGKKTDVPQGPRLAAPVIKHHTDHGRRIFSIQVPLPDRDDSYFRANFDEAGFVQESRAISVRFYILMLASSLAIAFLAWTRLRRYDWVDPRQHAEGESEASRGANKKIRHFAELLLGEMPHAALAVDRDNKIIGANTLALELLNCRKEELINLHVFTAPLPASVTDFYNASLKKPGQLSEAKLALIPKAPTMLARAIFSPAGESWELALVTLQ
jgi:PAS domain-containing protein